MVALAMTMADGDGDLLARWQAGEQRAGETLVERYFERLYTFFHTKLDQEADELVQATFLACLDAKDRFRGESTFKTFLYGIAKNHLYASLRRRHRDGDRLAFDVSSIAEVITTPRTRIGRNQDRERLLDAMRRLPIEQQTLLELHYWEELGIADLAAIFEAPAVTIRSRLHRARIALRDLLLTEHKGAAVAQTLEAMDDWARSTREERFSATRRDPPTPMNERGDR
jgi:RNA polymerase sigma-70 factor (ECF subfamily)